MKKIIPIVLYFVVVVALVGCGAKENESVVVGGDACPAITVDGVTYYDTGKGPFRAGFPAADCEIKYEELPIEGGATTESISAYAIFDNTTAFVLIDEDWYEFVTK